MGDAVCCDNAQRIAPKDETIVFEYGKQFEIILLLLLVQGLKVYVRFLVELGGFLVNGVVFCF